MDEKSQSSPDEEDKVEEEKSKPDFVKTEEGCSKSVDYTLDNAITKSVYLPCIWCIFLQLFTQHLFPPL